MFALLLCLSALLVLTGVCLARPLRDAAAVPSCPSGQQPMPELDPFRLSGSPRVQATGRLIKGLYYSGDAVGPHDMVAFHMACDRRLEPRPFLVMDFRLDRFFLDTDRDGCVDGTGTVPQPDIDPVDFYPALEGAEDLCDGEAVSSLPQGTPGAAGVSLRHPSLTGSRRAARTHAPATWGRTRRSRPHRAP